MWKLMAYNMFFNNELTDKGKDANEIKAKEDRLVYLRRKQGTDTEYYKDQLMADINLNKEKASELGEVDFKIYNV